MNSSQLLPVQFHGDTLFCLTYHDQPFTPMKPIVENLGLGWSSQRQKLDSNRDRWGVTMIVIPSDSGDQEMVCMPVRKLPAYMNSINPKKVRAELRAKIELYQNESDDALWKYWTDGQAVRQSAHHDTLTAAEQATILTPSTADDRKPLRSLVAAWAQVSGTPHQALWPQVKAHFQLARIDDLPLEWIGDALAFVQGKIDAAGKALPEGKPAHVFKRMGLTPIEELQMGTSIKQMLEGLDVDKIGPRTMECLMLKAKYASAILEVYRLNRELVQDLDRIAPSVSGQAMKALNKMGCFSDPVADTLYEPRYRLDRINEEYRAAALAALNSNICLARMLGI